VKGRLVGYYTDVSGYSVCVTNLVPVFNPIITAWETNIVVDCNRLTNAISFVGTVVPGKRLTLLVSTPDGKSVFTGVPVTTNVPDISGNWTGIKLQNTLPNQEFFTLTRNDPSANGYAVDGTGPGYQYGGLALLFKSGKFAFFSRIPANGSDNDTEVRVRAVVGTLNERAINFRTGGLDQFANDPDDPRTRIKFTSARISTPN
jgi:hypothetical protein